MKLSALAKSIGMIPETPAGIVADWLRENGREIEADAVQATLEATTLEDRITALVLHADAENIRHFKSYDKLLPPRHRFKFYDKLLPPRHRADYLSDKWCRIVKMDPYPGFKMDLKPGEVPLYKDASVYCFVALVNNTTRTLGHVKAGDIHKAAGFSKPAKHARGSVFDAEFLTCDHYGPAYLR